MRSTSGNIGKPPPLCSRCTITGLPRMELFSIILKGVCLKRHTWKGGVRMFHPKFMNHLGITGCSIHAINLATGLHIVANVGTEV